MDAQANDGCCAPTITDGFLRFFEDLPDPRAHNAIHKFTDMLILAFAAVLSGAEGWVDVAEFAQSKFAWFKTFLELPAGIPSHDTFGRVFAALKPDAFERCFTAWTAAVAGAGQGRLIAIDGKSIRRSFDKAWDKSGMTHLLSAFVAANGLVISQMQVNEKENEITAIPQLLELLELSGAAVSIDAIGCQRDIAEKIVAGGGDYLLAVKQNQPMLHEQVTRAANELILESKSDPERAVAHGFDQSVDKGHGRIETRRVWISNAIDFIKLEQPWPHLGSIIAVESKRDVGGKISVERRYYISSIRENNAKRAAELVRGHWSVENNLHWQLDVTFNEDQRRLRTGNSAENFSRLCRMALNRIKLDKTSKGSMRIKRKRASWDDYYLFKLLTT